MTLSSSSCRYGLSFSRLSSPSLTTEPSEVRTRAGSKGKGRRETQRDRVNLHIQRDALGTNLREQRMRSGSITHHSFTSFILLSDLSLSILGRFLPLSPFVILSHPFRYALHLIIRLIPFPSLS